MSHLLSEAPLFLIEEQRIKNIKLYISKIKIYLYFIIDLSILLYLTNYSSFVAS